MSKAAKMIKCMVKTKKESVMGKLGDSPYEDPMEPWSAKYNSPVKNEEVQIDEVSKGTLTSYMSKNKAHQDKLAKDFAAGDRSKERAHKIAKRDKGYLQAGQKIAKKDHASHVAANAGPQKPPESAEAKWKRENPNRPYWGEDVEQLEEDSWLFSYIKSLGYNPKIMSFAQRSKYARSNAFKHYKQSHMQRTVPMEQVEELDEAGTGLLMTYIKAKGLNPLTMDGNQKHSYARSSEFKVFKQKHASVKKEEFERLLKAYGPDNLAEIVMQIQETSGMGERGDDWNEETGGGEQMKTKKKKIKEEADKADTVTMDIPLLIRVLEYAREDAKTDMDLHKVVENLIKMRDQGTLSMAQYNAIVKIAEGVELSEVSSELLQRYKEKARKSADELHAQEKYGKAVKRYSGVMKATGKQIEKTTAGIKKTLSKGKITELKKMPDNMDADDHITREDLRQWFSKTHPEGDWKRINSKGEVAGPCAREPGEPKPKCMSKEKRAQLSKSERAAAVAAKRKYDPVADRAGKGGKPINVSNYGKGKLGEETEQLDEKNKPTNPALWSRAKAMARSKFDVYPSAYANGWASKWYKSKGGGWKAVKEDVVQEGIGGIEDSPLSATNSVKAMESAHRSKQMKSARMIKALYKNKIKETTYDWEKDDKPNAKIVMKGGTTMTGQPRDTVEIEPVLKTRPNSAKPSN